MPMIRKCAVLVMMLLGLCLTEPAHAQTNLLNDGNFSSVVNNIPSGWTVQWNTTDGSCVVPCEQLTGKTSGGQPYLQFDFTLDPTLNLASVLQNVQTVSGQKYVLTFLYGSYGNALSGSATNLYLYIGNSLTVGNTLPYSYTAGADPGLTFPTLSASISFVGDGSLWSFWFVDGSTSGKSQITDQPQQSDPASLVLANVSLTAVPEPASIALALVGLAGIAAARRRRRV